MAIRQNLVMLISFLNSFCEAACAHSLLLLVCSAHLLNDRINVNYANNLLGYEAFFKHWFFFSGGDGQLTLLANISYLDFSCYLPQSDSLKAKSYML